MVDDAVLARYLCIIKKCVAKEVNIDAHYQEDIQQEVFLKLFRAKTFERFNLNDEDQQNIAVAYIMRTVKNCHMDYLVQNNIVKKLSDEERSILSKRYQNLATAEDIDEYAEFIAGYSAKTDTIIVAKQALEIIKTCLDGALMSIKNAARARFLKEAFWRSEYDLPLKSLAETLGFDNSNPTQDFNRFVVKVDECTSSHGIKLNDVNNQVEIIAQLAELNGVTA